MNSEAKQGFSNIKATPRGSQRLFGALEKAKARAGGPLIGARGGQGRRGASLPRPAQEPSVPSQGPGTAGEARHAGRAGSRPVGGVADPQALRGAEILPLLVLRLLGGL